MPVAKIPRGARLKHAGVDSCDRCPTARLDRDGSRTFLGMVILSYVRYEWVPSPSGIGNEPLVTGVPRQRAGFDGKPTRS